MLLFQIPPVALPFTATIHFTVKCEAQTIQLLLRAFNKSRRNRRTRVVITTHSFSAAAAEKILGRHLPLQGIYIIFSIKCIFDATLSVVTVIVRLERRLHLLFHHLIYFLQSIPWRRLRLWGDDDDLYNGIHEMLKKAPWTPLRQVLLINSFSKEQNTTNR